MATKRRTKPRRIWFPIQNHADGGIWVNELTPERLAEMDATLSRAVAEGRYKLPEKRVEKVKSDGALAEYREHSGSRPSDMAHLIRSRWRPEYIFDGLEEDALAIKADPPELPENIAAASPARDLNSNVDELLSAIADARSAIAKGDARQAALAGYYVGRWAELLRFRTDHEAEVLNDRKNVKVHRNSGRMQIDHELERDKELQPQARAILRSTRRRNGEGQTAYIKRVAKALAGELTEKNPDDDPRLNRVGYERFCRLTEPIWPELGLQPRRPRPPKK